ncbi:Metallo-dependent phosphatase-like protein [Podospora appendiculata]|uniref:Metallo-dependent phosphatase-like protein n=1 Tax=Podospora appendiculata TaxID=314037 RepID=A0AAE0XA83_9PEZI|nr:Metallo-dependent phosphatase-like protein [Podospora appendiculata]
MASPDEQPSAVPVVTFSSGRPSSSPPDLRIVHYNDVYHLDPSSAEPVGGVARFITVCKEYRSSSPAFRNQPELLTFFSGDAFNPSLESAITKGSHMVPLLNKIGTNCACIGNHDLDFGVMQYRHLTSKCTFPWLLANVLDPALGVDVPLGNAKRTHLITASNGLKIGLIGLGEREWLETINALPPNLIYISATTVARQLVPQLRAAGADIIIALTHMREPNDNKLAEQMGGDIDIILGGHDHFYAHSFINGTHVLRSGSDFKQLSYLEARRRPDNVTKWDVDIWRRDMVASISEDADALALVDKLTAKLKKSLEKPIGWTTAPLDARFTTVRLRESNLGNLVCDIMRLHYGAECTIMAAGTIRGDQIYAPGPLRVKDITDCFPFEDPVVVIKVSGRGVWDALENSVSMYPALEGRFPQVSGIKFKFDPSKPVGSRILSVEIAGTPADLDRIYTVCTRGYMARGKDGFKSLLVQPEGGECEEIVSEENGVLISMMLRQYFMSLKVMNQWRCWGPSLDRHWGRIASAVTKSHPTGTGGRSAKAEKGEGEKDAPPYPKRKNSWDEWTPENLRNKRSSITPLNEENGEVDHEEDDDVVGGHEPEAKTEEEKTEEGIRDVDRELRVMRRVFRKWCRLAGVQGSACDELKEDEVECDWTKAIAPQLEGRIVMVGGK